MEGYKIVLVVFGTLIFALNYAAVFLSIYHIRYQPFNAKKPWGLLVALVAATLGWIGSLQTFSIINPEGMFSICSLWSVWVQFLLGSQLCLAVIGYRMLRLHFILVKRLPPTGGLFWTIQLVVMLPAIYCAFIVLIFHDRYLSPLPVFVSETFENSPVCEFKGVYYLACILASTLFQIIFLMVIDIY
jgi:hypothetical protein